MNRFGIMEGSKINIIICEAKNLPPMNVNGSADPFVVIKINEEELFQTEV